MATITLTETATPTVTGDRFVAGGLFVLTAIFSTLMLLAGEAMPFWLMPAVIYLVLGLAILRRGSRWLLITAVALPIVQVGTSAPFVIPGLTHPESPASFLPDVFIILASVTVVVGAVAALRGAQRRLPVAAAAGGIALVATVVSMAAAAGVSSAARQDGDVAIAAEGVAYPDRVVAEPGAALWVRNADPFRHTFVVEGTDIHAELPGGGALRIDAGLPEGSYTFFCDVPGHETMRGTLAVATTE
jgi:plastocyanin